MTLSNLKLLLLIWQRRRTNLDEWKCYIQKTRPPIHNFERCEAKFVFFKAALHRMSTQHFINLPLFQHIKVVGKFGLWPFQQSAPCCPLEAGFQPRFQPTRGRRRGEEDRGARNIQHVLFINEHQEEDDSRTHTNTHSASLMHTQITLAVFWSGFWKCN